MQLRRVVLERSPDNTGRVRLMGEVHYDDRKNAPETYWFDVDEVYQQHVSISGNPWLACLLPLAVTLGQPLEICAPVDSTLFHGVQEVMQIWKSWYPHLHVVPIEADWGQTTPGEPDRKAGAFFSGGVDSFFTILRQKEGLDDLIHVWGLDIPLRNRQAHDRMVGTLRTAAADLGKTIIEVSTNLRTTRLDTSGWGTLYFGCALASVGLALENRYRKIFIPSNGLGWDVPAWGSHPLTDPLLSTEDTRVIHDGFVFTRTQKTEFIAESPVVRNSLHVCFLKESDENCCDCMKCYRTMTTLAALGVLDQFRTMQTKPFDLSRVSKMYVPDEIDRFFHHEIRDLALRKGNTEIAGAIEKSLRHTDRLHRRLSVVRCLQKQRDRTWFRWLRKLSKRRWLGSMEKLLLRDSIA